MSIIQVENLSFKYSSSEKWAIHDISFTIEEGEFCAIIGSNESGKTSICNAIRGFIPHFYKGEYKGNVLVKGKNILESTIGELALEIGFVFQNPFTQISGVGETVYQELCFGLENIGFPKDKIEQRVNDIISITNIQSLVNQNPFELSGGQQQRVALASILVMDPDILIFDEPTSQLDPQSTEEIFLIIYALKKQGKTIILVEHKIELIAEYADRIILVENGEVALSGSTELILSDPILEKYNVPIPQYAELFHKIKERGIEVPFIPITEDKSINLLFSLLSKAKEGSECP
ncbi:energy-coupling factor ABC transporter ATP-binding protein [Fredinandcohnia humi]